MPHGSPKAKKIRKLVEKVDNIALLQNLIATLPGIEKKTEICRWFNPTLATTGMLQIVFLEKTFSPPRERAI